MNFRQGKLASGRVCVNSPQPYGQPETMVSNEALAPILPHCRAEFRVRELVSELAVYAVVRIGGVAPKMLTAPKASTQGALSKWALNGGIR